MTPEELLRIESLFEQAAELDKPRREAFLREHCNDTRVRTQVTALIERDRADSEVFDRPASETFHDLLESDAEDDMIGRQIGNYLIEREIGHGGMGRVYLASRADQQFEKRVAIKIVKRGMDSEVVLRRFRNERQALASLDHPNIARLLDGGVTEDGRPYLVMEHVEGKPITQFCDEHRLDVAERIELYRQVCAAVGYAHRHLIVHRDIKPANILVYADRHEAAPVPKLLDFGISKLLDPDPAFHDVTQADEPRPMTPAYAAPEQVRGEPVATATDVYLLGAVLYELLTGHPAHQADGLSRGAIERVICEVMPERPSAIVAQTKDYSRSRSRRIITPDAVAEARRTTPPKLRKRLSGDLDVILLTALAKDANDRYSSVERFSEDLRRTLEDEPILARVPGRFERLHKFIRRKKLPVALTAAAFGMVCVFAGVVTYQSMQLRAQSARAQHAADRAERINEYFSVMFRDSAPNGDMSVRNFVERARDRIDAEITDDPEFAADVHHTMGNVLYNMGRFAEARDELQRALDARGTLLGASHEQTLWSLNLLAAAMRELGQLQQAEELFERGLALSRKTRGEHDRLALSFLTSCATLRTDHGDFAGAETLLREAWSVQKEKLGEDDPYTLTTMLNLGAALERQNELPEAEVLQRANLAALERVHESNDRLVLNARYNLSRTLVKLENYPEARSLLEPLVAACSVELGEGHPNTLKVMQRLRKVYEQIGEHDQAKSLALRIAEARAGDGE